MAKPGISLCMIVRDEEEMLEGCLLSVREVVDEILVADTGSVDGTRQAAIHCGADVFDYPWDFSFSRARNFIMGKASYEWILLLDADERLFPEDGERLLNFIQTTKGDGAHFKVYNHVGTYGDGQYTLHNALRLVRNNGQYYFVGDIHEQISRMDHKPMDGLFAVTDIRLHHLGYLDSITSQKKKRERNIPLLMGELEKDPDNAFMLFNLGNEYVAQKEYVKALEWYSKAREHFQPQEAFAPHLIFRMALCYYHLQRYQKAVRILGEGLVLYPGCTDMEYLRGRIYMDWHRDFLAAESFQKAISMGQPHATLRFSDDCATTKPMMSLGELYMRQHDYEKAVAYYAKAVRADNNLHGALYAMAAACRKLGFSPLEIENRISALFADLNHVPNRVVLVDVLLSQGLWELCLKHLTALDGVQSLAGEVSLLWGKYFMQAGEYEKALEPLCIAVEDTGPYHVLPLAGKDGALMLFALILILLPVREEKTEEALQAMDHAFGCAGEKLCRQVLTVLAGGQEDHLQGGDDREVLPLFASLLKVLLDCGAYDLFEKTLYVLNFIESSKVLLSLAQVYLDCGFVQMARQTLLRSIKELDVMDETGAQILLESFWQGTEQENIIG